MNGALVKQWLSEQGMRPEELALKLNVSFSTVQNILAGRRVYSSTVTLLSQLMGVPESKLKVQDTVPARKAAGR